MSHLSNFASFDDALENHIAGNNQMMNSNVRYGFVALTLKPEEGFVQQFVRPLDVRLTGEVEQAIYNVGETSLLSRSQATDEMFVGLSSKIIHPTLTPSLVRPTNVVGGWGQRRFSFSLVLDREESDSPNRVTRYTITGFTGHSEMSFGNLVDPRMEFTVDKVTSVVVSRNVNSMGIEHRLFGSESVHMLRSSLAADLRSNNSEFLQTPDNLLQTAAMTDTMRKSNLLDEANGALTSTYAVPSAKLNNTPRYMQASHATPQGWLSKTVSSLVATNRNEAEKEDNPKSLFGNSDGLGLEFGKSSGMSAAHSLLRSDGVRKEFDKLLINMNGRSHAISNVFTLETLNRLVGFDVQDRINVTRTVGSNIGLNSESWAASPVLNATAYETSVAEAIRNILPRIIAGAGLVGLVIYVSSKANGFFSVDMSDTISMLNPENYNITCTPVLAVNDPTNAMLHTAQQKAIALVLQYIVAEYFDPAHNNFELTIQAGAVTATAIQFRSEKLSGQDRRFECPAWGSSINSHAITSSNSQFENNVNQMTTMNSIVANLVNGMNSSKHTIDNTSPGLQYEKSSFSVGTRSGLAI